MNECLEPGCSAPADSVEGHWMEATGFGVGVFGGLGVTERIWLDKFVCAAGHRYEVVDEPKTVTL